jgi:starch phosphorylase
MSLATEADTRTSLKEGLRQHLRYSLGRDPGYERASPAEVYRALALAVRDRMVDGILATERRYREADCKRIYYLSMEFLIGRSLLNNLANLGLIDEAQTACGELGVSLRDVEDSEIDAALGNGGLGRLAACFLDSMATLHLPGFGYGINYEYGLFRQQIIGGEQIEKPDAWRAQSSPWLIDRPQQQLVVPLYGRMEHSRDRTGGYNPMWVDWQVVVGMPTDMPIVGYGGQTVNTLRLYTARASQEVDMGIFNDGDYLKAVRQKVYSETISKVLYPSTSAESGRELRLIQEYFLCACAVQDIVRQYLERHDSFDKFASKIAIQLNDTHPALAVPELMRILIDQHDMSWEKAWDISQEVFGYTNHTLMPEALEKWSVPLVERVLPRHLQLIYEINRRFLKIVANKYPGDTAKLSSMSLIEEGSQKQVRMANLSIVGSHSVNGVAAVHSELVKSHLVPDFYNLWPEKFNNKTNGVTQRRWLLASNPELATLITDHIGDGWITDLDRLEELKPLAEDAAFRKRFRKIKQDNKKRLAEVVQRTAGEVLDPESMFDIQIKRIHEYKRQLLNLLHVVHVYLQIREGKIPAHPRTVMFAGKAAPGYYAAKQIIRLINDVGRVINTDPEASKHLKCVFVPDYRVTLAEVLIPAANLSEQVSTAGTEASGTGNMKFAMNGALTIGTLDGANIEIREAVGDDNIFIFGLTVPEAERLSGHYRPWEYYERSPAIKQLMDAFRSSVFCPHEPGRHEWVFHKLLAENEKYLHLADLDSYLVKQDEAAALYCDTDAWDRQAVLNVASMGRFSSDRTIRQYAEEIWDVKPV